MYAQEEKILRNYVKHEILLSSSFKPRKYQQPNWEGQIAKNKSTDFAGVPQNNHLGGGWCLILGGGWLG